VVASENIQTERNAGRVRFRLLPDGDTGIKNPAFGSTQADHNLTVLKGNELMCVYRADGFPAQSFSRDGGRTWSLPERMTYGPGRRAIKADHACSRIFRTGDGRYLFWYNNQGVSQRENSTPVFLSGGVLKADGIIHWSEPELSFYDRNLAAGISCPDLVEQKGRFWFTETQKSVARIHEVNRAVLEGLWRQGAVSEVSRDGVVAECVNPGDFHHSFAVPASFGDLERGGLTVDLWVQIDNVASKEILVSTVKGRRGMRVVTTAVQREPTVQIELYDGDRQAVWQTDPGLIKNDRLQHIVFLCDTRADVIGVVVDGVYCDGGEKRPFGWGRIPPGMNPVAGAEQATMSGSVRRIRLYDRVLHTSEAVGNFRAGSGTGSGPSR
jgi:hypothetical protein